MVLFVAASVALHASLLLLPMPHDGPGQPDVTASPFVVEVVRELLPPPPVHVQPTLERPPRPHSEPRRRARVVGNSATPQPEEGGHLGEPPLHDAPAPLPSPAPVIHRVPSPERAALRVLALAEDGETLQGRVDDMFNCARSSNGRVSCAGFGGGGWGRGGDDVSRQGWGEPVSRTAALRTAIDLYCE